MRDLGQRIVLIHELRKLTGTEKFLDRGGDGFGIDNVLRHQAFAFNHAKPLTHGTLYTHQADAENVFSHLTHTTNTAVTKVIYVIDSTITISDIDQHAQHVQDIFLGQRTFTLCGFPTQPSVELHTPNR